MERNELLHRLNHLVKDLNNTHTRLQECPEEHQQIEAALLSQQVIKLYSYIRKIQLSIDGADEIRSFTVIKKQTETAKKKETLLKHTSEKVLQATVAQEPKPIEKIPEPTPVIAPTKPVSPPTPPVVETPKAATPEPEKAVQPPQQKVDKKAMLHEKFTDKQPSLHDKLSNKTATPNLAQKMEAAPITDIKAAISLNMRISFIKHLFKGDDRMYLKSMDSLNRCGNFNEAKFFVDSEIIQKYMLKENTPQIAELMALVARRYS
ncbi:MAG: hypothetical protein NTX03_02450 [Bacteroidetes bacterium]|nr:hypothetical protein [Bacteroidota bacterium]